MLNISSIELCHILASESQVMACNITNISTDSRQIAEGDLFIALKGEKFDGHDYVAEVLRKGAALVVVSEFNPDIAADRQIVVKDTLAAYGEIASYVRSQFSGIVIGLTGSAGKTTTKEEIKFVLSKFASVYATSGNFNNGIGVPHTLCNLDMNAKYAIIEMGMSAKGEISDLVKMVKPDIAIVTNVYPMHIEFFESFEGIAEAKAEIFEGLNKGGTAIINEDTNFADILEKRALEHGAKIVRFGEKNHSDVKFELSQEGEHHLYNAWCVLRVVEALGLDVAKAASYLKDFGALDGRGKHWNLIFPGGHYTLIDDSYSGQPEAMKLALKSLGQMKSSGRKIAVLGKMAELGDTSKQQHTEVGQAAAAAHLDIVIGICPEMKDMLAQVPDTTEKHYFENKEGLDEFLLNKVLQNNDIVLIKGARYSSKLYTIAEALIKQGKE